MPKLLVAVMSCWRSNYTNPQNPDMRDYFAKRRDQDPAARRDACRNTWLRGFTELGIDYQFFLGRPTLEQKGKLGSVFVTDPDPPITLFDETVLYTGDGY